MVKPPHLHVDYLSRRGHSRHQKSISGMTALRVPWLRDQARADQKGDNLWLYIVRRLLTLPLVLLAVTLMIFAMTQALSPYQRAVTYASNPLKLRDGDLETIIKQYGLDDPIHVQYFRWINNVAHGNLGWSETASMPVTEAFAKYLPATLELALFTLFVEVALAVWLGVVAATHQNRFIDHVLRILGIAGWSLPTYVVAIALLGILFGMFGLFPPGRLGLEASAVVNSVEFVRYTGMNIIDSILNGNAMVLGDALKHLFLPLLTISLVGGALILRVMRSSMLETLKTDYITTARSKGLTEKRVIRKHAFRNALISVMTIFGMTLASILGGSVVVETVFDYRGLGQWVATAATQLDFATIVGFCLFSGAIMVLANLLVDIMYAVIDPRIRL